MKALFLTAPIALLFLMTANAYAMQFSFDPASRTGSLTLGCQQA